MDYTKFEKKCCIQLHIYVFNILIYMVNLQILNFLYFKGFKSFYFVQIVFCRIRKNATNILELKIQKFKVINSSFIQEIFVVDL